MTEAFACDVFASKDKPGVRELAERLKRDGLRVWLDEWVIQPGESISLPLEQGLESSQTLVLAISRHAFGSDWVTLQGHTALFRDPANVYPSAFPHPPQIRRRPHQGFAQAIQLRRPGRSIVSATNEW